jgi:uroporphyrinogen-III synthase
MGAAATAGPALAGCVIGVTADRRFKELAAELERRGANVEHAPALEVVPHLDDESLVQRTGDILAEPPDVVVATTGIGFRGWVEAADAAGLAESFRELVTSSAEQPPLPTVAGGAPFVPKDLVRTVVKRGYALALAPVP